MSTATEEKQKPTTPATPEETPTPKEPKPPAEPTKKPDPKAEPPVAAAPDGGRHKLNDDEEIPENADLLELSPRALTRRLQRHTKKELKEHFGTDDLAKIKADLAELATLKTEKETERRAKLDSEAKAKEDREHAEQRAVKAETKLHALREARVVDKEDTRLRTIAEKFIKPKFWKHVSQDLKDHIREFSSEALEKFKDKDLERWFKQHVGDNPEFARESGAPLPKVPFTNGSDDPQSRVTPNETTNGGKTMKPGQANSMSAAEARAEAGKSGYRW